MCPAPLKLSGNYRALGVPRRAGRVPAPAGASAAPATVPGPMQPLERDHQPPATLPPGRLPQGSCRLRPDDGERERGSLPGRRIPAPLPAAGPALAAGGRGIGGKGLKLREAVNSVSL